MVDKKKQRAQQTGGKGGGDEEATLEVEAGEEAEEERGEEEEEDGYAPADASAMCREHGREAKAGGGRSSAGAAARTTRQPAVRPSDPKGKSRGDGLEAGLGCSRQEGGRHDAGRKGHSTGAAAVRRDEEDEDSTISAPSLKTWTSQDGGRGRLLLDQVRLISSPRTCASNRGHTSHSHLLPSRGFRHARLPSPLHTCTLAHTQQIHSRFTLLRPDPHKLTPHAAFSF